MYKVRVFNRKSIIFYHIAGMKNWHPIVLEHTQLLCQSGLYEHADKIVYAFVGSEEDFEVLELLTLLHPKIEAVHTDTNIRRYEFPTLELLQDHANAYDDDIMYFHTKGVSYNPEHKFFEAEIRWRNYMNFFVIKNWEICKSKLLDHDTASVARFIEEGRFVWYAGNYWWSTAEHIRKCQDIRTMDQKDRWNAERWLGTTAVEPNTFSFEDEFTRHQDYIDTVETEVDWQRRLNNLLRYT